MNWIFHEAGIPLTIGTDDTNHAILSGVGDNGGFKGSVVDMDLNKGTAQTRTAVFLGGKVIVGDETASVPADLTARQIARSVLDAADPEQKFIYNNLVATRHALESEPDPKKALMQEEADLQSGTKQADAHFDEVSQRKQQIALQLNNYRSAEQTLRSELDKDLSTLPTADQQTFKNIESNRMNPADAFNWAESHPEIARVLGSYSEANRSVEFFMKQQQDPQATDAKVAAHLMFAQALSRAGDPRAKAQYNAAFTGLSSAERQNYEQWPEVKATAKMVGETLD